MVMAKVNTELLFAKHIILEPRGGSVTVAVGFKIGKEKMSLCGS